MQTNQFLTALCRQLRNLVRAAVCLAAALLLPFLTGQIPQIGSALCPMHIPILLAGFLCGPGWAAAAGLIAPPLRYLLFGMPPLFPTGVAMSFELAAYGLAAGLLYRCFRGRRGEFYLSLIPAMLAGRLVWGAVRALLSGVADAPFTWGAFWAGAFVNAVPAIILHILIIPPLAMALKRAGVIPAKSR